MYCVLHYCHLAANNNREYVGNVIGPFETYAEANLFAASYRGDNHDFVRNVVRPMVSAVDAIAEHAELVY